MAAVDRQMELSLPPGDLRISAAEAQEALDEGIRLQEVLEPRIVAMQCVVDTRQLSLFG